MRNLVHIRIRLDTQIDLNDSFSFGVRLTIESQTSLYVGRIGEVHACIGFLDKKRITKVRSGILAL